MRRHTREDSGISLDRELKWWHDGEPVEHPKVIEAFNRGLKVTEDGRYRLEIGDDWCFVTVAEAAYGVVAFDVSEDGQPSVRLSDRTAEALDAASLKVGADGVLSVKVKAGRAWARFSRDAQFALGQYLKDGEAGLTFALGGREWPVAS